MKKNKSKQKNSSLQALSIVRECPCCGELFTTTKIKDEYGKTWCEKYGFCTQECMEHMLDYDGFKDSIRDSNDKSFISWESKWEAWIEKKIPEVFEPFFTIEELFEMEKTYIKDKHNIKTFCDIGFDVCDADQITFGDFSDD